MQRSPLIKEAVEHLERSKELCQYLAELVERKSYPSAIGMQAIEFRDHDRYLDKIIESFLNFRLEENQDAIV